MQVAQAKKQTGDNKTAERRKKASRETACSCIWWTLAHRLDRQQIVSSIHNAVT